MVLILSYTSSILLSYPGPSLLLGSILLFILFLSQLIPPPLILLRPISLTPFLSKVLEKLCFVQLLRYFDSCSAIPPFQSGFRRGHSTSTALLHISDTVLRAFDSRRLTCITSLDFSKAFDTIDHNLLCAKLGYLGLSSSALSLLKSYLSPAHPAACAQTLSTANFVC